jgi:hypothetical protein
MRLPLALALLFVTPPALAGGYGQFEWETPLKTVKQRLKQRRVRAAPDAEPVAFEKDALAEIQAFDKKQARRKGRKAWRAWRRSKKARRRLSALRYWLRIYGLHARVELRFMDRKLYGAVVRVLYDEARKTNAGQVLDLLAEKYGEPTSRAAGPEGVRTRMTFDGADGVLTVFTETAGKKRRGLLRMAYHANRSGALADRYIDAVRARLVQVMVANDKQREAKEEAELQKAKDRLLRHL